MANGNGNGRGTTVIQVGTAIALIVAIAGGSFTLGIHIGDTGVHEGPAAKEARIRNLVEHEIDPRLSRIESDIGQIKQDIRSIRDDDRGK